MPPKGGGRGDSLATMAQVTCWRQRLEKEDKINAGQLHKDMAAAGDLNRKNDFMYQYKPASALTEDEKGATSSRTRGNPLSTTQTNKQPKVDIATNVGGEQGRINQGTKRAMETGQVGTRHIPFTIDKINDAPPFDAKAPDDTMYPHHEMHKIGFKSARPLRTSQQYGWYAPIDQPKFGFERTRICEESFMDKSHL